MLLNLYILVNVGTNSQQRLANYYKHQNAWNSGSYNQSTIIECSDTSLKAFFVNKRIFMKEKVKKNILNWIFHIKSLDCHLIPARVSKSILVTDMVSKAALSFHELTKHSEPFYCSFRFFYRIVI